MFNKVCLTVGIIAISVLVVLVTTFLYGESHYGVQNVSSHVLTTRYLLFGGTYHVDSSNSNREAVFKLDTYTGDTWLLEVKKGQNNMYTEKWKPVDFKYGETVQQLMQNTKTPTKLRGLEE